MVAFFGFADSLGRNPARSDTPGNMPPVGYDRKYCNRSVIYPLFCHHFVIITA